MDIKEYILNRVQPIDLDSLLNVPVEEWEETEASALVNEIMLLMQELDLMLEEWDNGDSLIEEDEDNDGW